MFTLFDFILSLIKLITFIIQLPEFIKLLAQTRLVISDSGGLQEETSFLKKKCIVCRKTTERLEGVNTFAFMCLEPEGLEEIFNQVNADHIPVGDCPYGDGYAAEKVYEVLKDEV